MDYHSPALWPSALVQHPSCRNEFELHHHEGSSEGRLPAFEGSFPDLYHSTGDDVDLPAFLQVLMFSMRKFVRLWSSFSNFICWAKSIHTTSWPHLAYLHSHLLHTSCYYLYFISAILSPVNERPSRLHIFYLSNRFMSSCIHTNQVWEGFCYNGCNCIKLNRRVCSPAQRLAGPYFSTMDSKGWYTAERAMQLLWHTESGPWQLQQHQPKPCFLFISKFSLFATGQQTPTVTVTRRQGQYFGAACMWYKPQLAMLLTCTPCTAWNMCSKTTMLLG